MWGEVNAEWGEGEAGWDEGETVWCEGGVGEVSFIGGNETVETGVLRQV